ncbi:MAG: histidine kinase [Candidatus Eiseniibacteriota bacterium]|nr:MAG: histidine kinase [Candidatus Eisenbacteria bacterium]
MENPLKQLPLLAMVILVAAMILITGTLVSIGRGHFNFQNYVYGLTYTVACAFWVGLILAVSYNFIARLRRAHYYLFFTGLILVGTALGTQTASLIIHKRLYAGPRITAFSVVVSLGLAILAIANEHLRESLSKRVAGLKESEIERKILERSEAEARTSSLHTRLDPQFLVNTLDNVAALMRQAPERAEQNITKLSNLYERALSMNNQSLLSLGDELALLEDYFQLEAQRLGERFRFVIDCPAELREARVPAFLLEPLVENSIKHGSSGGTLNVGVKVWREEKHLFVRVADDGRGFDQKRTPFGLGLFGIQQRLDLIYKDAYRFEIESEVGKGTSVTLRLPVDS